MNIAFKTEKLAKQCSCHQELLKAFKARAIKISQRLDEIRDSDHLAMLKKLPALNCNPLTHNPTAEWALNITPNYAMIFSFNHDPLPLTDDGSIDLYQVTEISIIGFMLLTR
jgi:plasmid maintenance system killer protein